MTQLRVPFNELSRHSEGDLNEYLAVVNNVIQAGVFLRGPYTSALENHLEEQVQGMHAVCVASGTDALVLALLGLGLGAGDRIATVANAGGYASGAIFRVDAHPILIDVDPTTGQIDVNDLISKATTTNLKAVVVTHLFGLMAQMEMIREVTDRYNLVLIEDCAQAYGATQNGVPAGSWGSASTFSFYPTKNLGAFGDAGAVLFANREDAKRCRQIAQYGWSTRYIIEQTSGINSRIDEIQAAVLLTRLRQLKGKNDIRRSIVRRYSEAVKSPRRLIFADNDDFVGHLAVLVTPERSRDLETLSDAGIGTSIHYPVPDHKQPAWRSYFSDTVLVQTETLCNTVISLPCFPTLGDHEVAYVSEILRTL